MDIIWEIVALIAGITATVIIVGVTALIVCNVDVDRLILDKRAKKELKREREFKAKQDKLALEERILMHKVALKKLELLEKGIKINE